MSYSISLTGFLDLSLVIALGQYDLKILTDKYLKSKGIIPNDWQLASPAESNARQIDLLFKNGVRITGQPGAIRFVESIVGKTSETLLTPAIVRQFIKALPSLDYRGLGVNPRRYAAFSGGPESTQHFMNEQIMPGSTWHSFGKAPVRTSLDLGFTLEHCLLRVNIQEARIQLQDQQAAPAILFMGNYHYAVQGQTEEERLNSLYSRIDQISDDLTSYQDLIDHRFLGQGEAEMQALSDSKTAFEQLSNHLSPQPVGV